MGFQPTPANFHGQETKLIWAWRLGVTDLLLSRTFLLCSQKGWCFGRSDILESACCRLHCLHIALTTISNAILLYGAYTIILYQVEGRYHWPVALKRSICTLCFVQKSLTPLLFYLHYIYIYMSLQRKCPF